METTATLHDMCMCVCVIVCIGVSAWLQNARHSAYVLDHTFIQFRQLVFTFPYTCLQLTQCDVAGMYIYVLFTYSSGVKSMAHISLHVLFSTIDNGRRLHNETCRTGGEGLAKI